MNVIKSESEKMFKNEDIYVRYILLEIQLIIVISDSCNNHFLTIAEKINNATVKSKSNPLFYLS
jgi:hypothetical protein